MTADPLHLLDHLDALSAKATAGPWRVSSCWRNAFWQDRDYLGALANQANTELIVAARNALPGLVAALRGVLAVHQPYETPGGHRWCTGHGGGLRESSYPCTTVRAITDALGDVS